MTERRFALIIATDQYEDKDLRQLISPAHDAEALARVLKDPDIGGFEVKTLLNENSYCIRRVIETFFIERKREDLLLLYFSCHGIKDEDGRLYFSTTDTDRRLLRATAIESHFVTDVMQRSRSRRQVLLLDCCYGGAFARGMLTKADKRVVTRGDFEGEGQGRVVLTASDAMQYSFEGDQMKGSGIPSVFTGNLVHGLETGAADRDGDGHITIDELYDYVHDRVVDETPDQRPAKWDFGVQGRIVIARNPNPVVKPVELPPEVKESVKDLRHWVREGAIRELERILKGNNKGLALSAQEALRGMMYDDSQRVREEVTRILGSFAETQSVKESKTEKQPIALEDVAKEPATVEKKETETLQREQKEEKEEEENIVQQPPRVLGKRPTGISKRNRMLIWLLPSILVPLVSGVVVLNVYLSSILTYDEAESMLEDKGFFDSSKNKSASGFPNDYELQHDGKVVYDRASGLMWQRSGSDKGMPYRRAKAYVAQLNIDKFAGYNDWGLPTLEEAMSLMEPKKNSDGFYIDSIFDKEQRRIWTSDLDSASSASAWVVHFDVGFCYGSVILSDTTYVRAVR